MGRSCHLYNNYTKLKRKRSNDLNVRLVRRISHAIEFHMYWHLLGYYLTRPTHSIYIYFPSSKLKVPLFTFMLWYKRIFAVWPLSQPNSSCTTLCNRLISCKDKFKFIDGRTFYHCMWSSVSHVYLWINDKFYVYGGIGEKGMNLNRFTQSLHALNFLSSLLCFNVIGLKVLYKMYK